MEPNEQNEVGRTVSVSRTSERSGVKYFLNIVIAIMLIVVSYLSYAFFSRSVATQKSVDGEQQAKVVKIIQLDVLNGCGAKGVAAKFTNVLRSSGFDVVEMKNYKTKHIPRTLVVDRVGNLEPARRIAAALGVSERSIIQQINPDYFVDVSVIIGDDYMNLRPMN